MQQTSPLGMMLHLAEARVMFFSVGFLPGDHRAYPQFLGNSELDRQNQKCPNDCDVTGPTLPGTNSSPVKIDGWNTSFLLGWPILGGKLFALGRVIHRFFRSIPKLVLHGNGHLRIPHWELRRRCSAS